MGRRERSVGQRRPGRRAFKRVERNVRNKYWHCKLNLMLVKSSRRCLKKFSAGKLLEKSKGLLFLLRSGVRQENSGFMRYGEKPTFCSLGDFIYFFLTRPNHLELEMARARTFAAAPPRGNKKPISPDRL